MLKQDFVAIALYITAICVAVLVWIFRFYWLVVPIAMISTALGWVYFNYRNRWLKKKNGRNSEGGD